MVLVLLVVPMTERESLKEKCDLGEKRREEGREPHHVSPRHSDSTLGSQTLCRKRIPMME